MTEAEKEHWQAVGYFFHSFWYMELIDRFGDVPWVNKVLTEESPEIYGERMPRTEVADSVLTRLQWAETHIGDFESQDGSNTINRDCVRAALSRFTLREGTWRKYHGLEGSDKYLERLSRIAREAVKQCGRSLPPRIGPALGFDQALSAMAAHEALFMPYELGGEPLLGPLRERDVGLLIGPEGGIAPEEARAVAALGGRAVTLGSRILRTETAGLVALTLVMHLCGELGGTAP